MKNDLPSYAIRHTLNGATLLELPDGKRLRVAAPGAQLRDAIDSHSLDLASHMNDYQPLKSNGSLTVVADAHLISAVSDVLNLLVRDGHPSGCVKLSRWLADENLRTELAKPNGIFVFFLAGTDYLTLARVEDEAATLGLRWMPATLTAGEIRIGPAIHAGRTPTYRDLVRRRLAAAVTRSDFATELRPVDLGQAMLPPAAECAWILAYTLADAGRWAAGGVPECWWHEVSIDISSRAKQKHLVLPMPDEVPALADETEFHTSELVDAQTGLITRLQRIPYDNDVPLGLITYQSWSSDTSRLFPWATNLLNAGHAWRDDLAAREIAVGEAVERYCGNYVGGLQLAATSYKALTARGERAVHPDSLVLHSDEQYATDGFPFVPFKEDLELHWVQGYSVTTQSPIWVPASTVFINWHTGGYESDPPLHGAFYPGIAAGPTLESALTNGLEEVIERDAMMVWWLSGHTLPCVEHPLSAAMEFEGLPAHIHCHLVHIDNQFGVPVMAGIVEDEALELLTVGFAARHTPTAAAMKAWLEAFALHASAIGLQDPESTYWRLSKRHHAMQKLKPPRADRRYLDDYRSDFRDVSDLWCQLQIYLDPRTYRWQRPWDTTVRRSLTGLPRVAERNFGEYARRVMAKGFEVIYVDVTTPDVAVVGMHAVRVLVPGLAPNFPAAFPPLGGDRIAKAPVDLGWRTHPLSATDIVRRPIPYA